jgi:hypothetical protein
VVTHHDFKAIRRALAALGSGGRDARYFSLTCPEPVRHPLPGDIAAHRDGGSTCRCSTSASTPSLPSGCGAQDDQSSRWRLYGVMRTTLARLGGHCALSRLGIPLPHHRQLPWASVAERPRAPA